MFRIIVNNFNIICRFTHSNGASFS
ncbi:hypothetical protein CY0110_18692 [Crocosphaera chwakensis CCY0110]|uniref:Uncharacterized protein n=1 Tax=Crocosphaera chwakensis CCY0110 TaxID=391612 RepID=A3IJ70_9CHRO|nr:hypothetical protein CY0110_18692 [Crocosphaera chwakensis CCY0110]